MYLIIILHYITNVSYAAGIADDDAYHSTEKYPQYNGLHGLGAYSANLHALWEYALFIANGESPEVAKESVRNALSEKEHKMVLDVEGKDKPYTPMNLINVCKKMLGNEKTIGSGDYPNETERKKYLVVGFGCHMIGDIYAHRTLVPEYVFDMDTKDKEEYGENLQPSSSSSSYDARLGESDFENWGNLIDVYSDDDTRPYFTFPKLDNYSKGGLKLNDKYEDNPNFCRERFAAALSCTKEFLSMVSSARRIEPDPTIIRQEYVDAENNIVNKHVFLSHYNDYMPYYTLKKGQA